VFLEIDQSEKEVPVVAMFVNGYVSDLNTEHYTTSPICMLLNQKHPISLIGRHAHF
jgi:hypothetical protein